MSRRDELFNNLTKEFPDVPLGVLRDVWQTSSQHSRALLEMALRSLEFSKEEFCDRYSCETGPDHLELSITAIKNALEDSGRE